jgi:para-aminobenzoate synthetase component 1
VRTIKSYRVDDIPGLKKALLTWAQQFKEIVWLDSNDYRQKHSKFDAVLAVEAFTAIETSAEGAFDRLEEYQRTSKDWLFGYLTYDLKNDVEELTSKNPDGLNFPDLYFFQPKKLFLLKDDLLELHYLRMVDDEMEEDLQEIFDLQKEAPKMSFLEPVQMQPRIPKQKYLEKVKEMLGHIQRGDIYEANFCQEFFAEDAKINPLKVYQDLNAISGPPFAGFLKLNDKYLLSASPERYLQKTGTTIISQPIKGTAPRGVDPDDDQKRIRDLENDPKERSENVMIVDLVRNDLSKTAKKGSVQVEELCRIYSFEQVHQMISTVRSEVAEGIPAVEVIRSTFPMGSMTGAPKISAMKIIEELEESRRGLYSGAVGYFTPEGDFDLNVVIRSILYNEKEQYVSFTVGGAITSRSIPENEYLECQVKARALKQVLEGKKPQEQ